tara:strand:- start:6322 stop:7875 length:1554 start_codon:yes stop_codon:yes gene_type:complete
MDLIQQFTRARNRGVPIVVVRTADPAGAFAALAPACTGPIVQWDGARGGVIYQKSKTQEIPELPIVPADALVLAATLPGAGEKDHDGAALFMLHAHRYWNEADVMVAIWALRDTYKRDFRTLVLFALPGSIVPTELTNDVIVLDHELPGTSELTEIVHHVHTAARKRGATVPAQPESTIVKAVDAIAGVHAFGAEQLVSMWMHSQAVINETGETLDLDALWEGKRRVIEQTKGLSVHRGGERFAGIGGLRSVIDFLQAFFAGLYRVGSIVWFDEVEKAMAGAQASFGDGGVAADAHGWLLSWLQDKDVPAVLFAGVPGSGKSLIAKAAGAECGAPCVRFDMGAMLGSLMGESQTAIRQGTAVVDAVSQGRPLVIATSNNPSALSPEFRARFRLGTYFFDNPDSIEKPAIWDIHRAKQGIGPDDPQPNDDGWTGREIEQCCVLSRLLQWPLAKAAERIVPVASTARDQFDAIRREAEVRGYLSASKPGPYRYDANDRSHGRALDLSEALPGSTSNSMN